MREEHGRPAMLFEYIIVLMGMTLLLDKLIQDLGKEEFIGVA